MTVHRLGIIMHGVTGRMGLNQHLVRSILAIRDQGGVLLANGERVIPDPIVVGRNAEKVAALARQFGIERSTADLDSALANPDDTVFFDAATTQMRGDLPDIHLIFKQNGNDAQAGRVAEGAEQVSQVGKGLFFEYHH